MCHTQEPYTWVDGQLLLWVEVLTQWYLVNCVLALFTFKPHRNLFFCVIKWKHMKRFLGVVFQIVPNLLMICCSKKVHFTRKHTSLGSIIGEFIDPFEILIPMPKFGQKLSIYICLSPVKMVDFMDPKWEGFVILNSFIFVVVSKNTLYCLNLGKNYPCTKAASNEKWRDISRKLIQPHSPTPRVVEKLTLF